MRRLRQLLDDPAKDHGVALILVLFVVAVIGLAGAALLTFSDTSIRTTVALRDQAATAYAADGAGQVAVAKLAGATYPNNCATVAGDPLSLGDGATAFYTAPKTAAALNAYVTCAPNTTTGTGTVVGTANKPVDAMFTVGNDSGVIGQNYGTGAANKTVSISNGNVISKSSISTGSDTLAVSGTGVKVLALTGSSPNCVGTFSPTPCATGASAVTTPTYPAPTDAVNAAPAPVCSGSYAAFKPGFMNQAYLTANLNAGCGQKSVVWFSPGTYYFTFTGSWNAPARLVGGTPTDSSNVPIAGLVAANSATLSNLSQLNPASPGACADPSEQDVPNGGVIFVFGSTSKVNLGANNLEICATYSASKVPIAIYGPTAAIPVQGGTGPAVPLQTVCKLDTCALFTNDSNGQATFHIQGLTYAPNARMVLNLKNSDGQNFNWGLVLRSFSLAINGTSPTGPFVQLPANSTAGATTYSIMYLNVWVCPKSATACDHSGAPQLRAKVQVTGSPATATVLSWSVQR